jgi:tetratricopeptide (TPR) repeat protein
MILRGSRRWLALLVCLAAGGCRSNSSPSSAARDGAAPAKPAPAAPARPGAAPAASAPAASAPSAPGPLPRTQLRTTSAKIALRNFDGTIADLEKRLAASPNDRATLEKLARHLVARAQLRGTLADYDKAVELTTKLAKKWPELGTVYLERAAVHAALHRFKEALVDLARAQKLGKVPATHVEMTRLGVLQAMGRFDKVQPERERLAAIRPTPAHLLPLASLLADRGLVDKAEAVFRRAEREYRAVSPFPLVQLYYREGLMWEQAGQIERARRFYEGAHERLSVHAGVTSRLAAVEALLGKRTRAIGLLRELTAQSDDPEYQAQLAELLRDDGKTAEAEALLARARTRYEELVKKHPAAFADHAARFWLGAGKDPARALPLAEKNLEVRRTPEAYQLVIRAGLAAKKPERACTAADQALKSAQPAWLKEAATRAFAACGRKASAATPATATPDAAR